MTEQEWQTEINPEPMLVFLGGAASGRKLRLFACNCCRSMFSRVRLRQSIRDTVTTAERYADGLCDRDELAEAGEELTSDWTAVFACREAAAVEGGYQSAIHAADNAAWEVGSSVAASVEVYDDDHPVAQEARRAENVLQSQLLRDIFGNPFRPIAVDPAWLTSTAVGLAHAIYDDRAFDRLPILADALQDAGCEDADMLAHCRDNGPHVRGCWVVDLVLGKK